MKIIRIEDFGGKFAALAEAKSLFDVVRKKQVAATPEEKIRQLMIQYLIGARNFPKSLLGVEVSISVNRLSKRCDILAYKDGLPVMIVECKAPSVKIDQSVFEQAARYNLALKVPYLLVTNGLVTLCCKVNLIESGFEFLDEIPEYRQLQTPNSKL